MKKEVFLHICKVCGDPTRTESERWRDIKYIGLSHNRGIINFQSLVKKDQALFVDKKIMVGEEMHEVVGFYILESMHPDVSMINEIPHLTFHSLEEVKTVSFTNVHGIEKLSEFFSGIYT